MTSRTRKLPIGVEDFRRAVVLEATSPVPIEDHDSPTAGFAANEIEQRVAGAIAQRLRPSS